MGEFVLLALVCKMRALWQSVSSGASACVLLQAVRKSLQTSGYFEFAPS